jgi:hypothetical protein
MRVMIESPRCVVEESGRIFNLAGTEFRQYSRVRGYKGVLIGGKQYLVSRLVLTAFEGHAAPNEEAIHLNGNRADNRLLNLKWGSHSENMAMERGNTLLSHKGEKNPNNKLSTQDVLEIREAYSSRVSYKWGRRSLAKKFNVSEAHIGRIAMSQNGGWKHI